MSPLREWLESIGLGQYSDTFEQNDLDIDVLGELSEDELSELGLSLGHRKRLIMSLRSRDSLSNSADAAEISASRPEQRPHAERRNVTVMFCDLVGSTALADGMDPEAFRDLLGIYHDAAREPIRRYDGHIARYLGDGLLVFFGFPRAREDDAVRAVRSAIEVTRAIEALPNRDLQVRLGIATGIVVAGDIVGTDRHEDQTVLGDVPNLAARLQSSAEPNSVLIAKSTFELVGDSVHAEELPPLSLNGIANPVPAYRVLRIRDAKEEGIRGSTRQHRSIVGREGELALIHSRWDLAQRGSGQVVLISAEAGVGKSGLVRQFREDTESASRMLISFYCSPYQSGTPFFPIANAISRGAGITPHDSVEQRIDKLKAFLDEIDYGATDGVAILGSVLGIETSSEFAARPDERRRRTLEFLSELVARMAQESATLIIVEDLHFADSSTVELMSLLAQRLGSSTALVLITFRPNFESRWVSLANATSIAINHLSADEARRLVRDIGDGRNLPSDLEDEIIARCDGVPLFIEELTKSVLDSLDHEAQDVAIPATLRDTLAARLDAVGPAKRIAQLASIIGREFSYQALEGFIPDHERLAQRLHQLETAELILRRGEAPDARYLFKHALVQEAAYESMLHSDRRASHLALGEKLAQQGGEMSAAPGLVALHFERGGDLRRAIDYRHLAGKEAAKSSAFHEAEEHFQKAVELFGSLTDTENMQDYQADLLLGLGAVQMPLYGYPSQPVYQTYAKCYELLQSSESLSRRFDATWGLCLNRTIAGDLDRSEELGSELDAIAAQSQSLSHKLQADHSVWTVAYIIGDLGRTYERTQAVRNFYSVDQFGDHCFRYGGHDPYICAQCHGALSRWQMGHPIDAMKLSRDSLDLAQILDHPPSTGVGASLSGIVFQYAGDPEAILAIEEQAERAPANMRLIMRALVGWSKARLGNIEEGLVQCRAGVEAYRDLGAKARLSYVEYLLADTYRMADRLDEAMQVIEPACDQPNDITTKAERIRLKGSILERMTETQLAEHAFLESIAIAREQGANAWELRAANAVAGLWLSQGRRREARDVLNLAFGRFKEGFDTADLVSARNLLSKLTD